MGNSEYIKMRIGQILKQKEGFGVGILENIHIDLCVCECTFLCLKIILQTTKLKIRKFVYVTNVSEPVRKYGTMHQNNAIHMKL